MSGLPREILKWIQALDLSYSVKNVRRDFSNGFLVAEICSRFAVQDIQMHSFDNASSLPRKQGNWKLLKKFFKKRQVPVKDDLVENVMHHKPEAASELLVALYMFFTKKSVQINQPTFDDEIPLPAFAQPTASSLVKATIPESELAVNQNVEYAASRTQDILTEHMRNVQTEKAHDPTRFVPKRASPSKKSSASSQRRDLLSKDGTPNIQFKEVQVRKLGGGVAKLRATRELLSAQRSTGGYASQVSSYRSVGPSEGADDGTQYPFPEAPAQQAVPSQSILYFLNGVVETALRDTEYIKNLDPQSDYVVSFIDMLPSMQEEVYKDIFKGIENSISRIVESSLAAPREFWNFFSVFSAGLSFPDTIPQFQHIVRIICEVGSEITRRQHGAAWRMFVDFAFPRVRDMLVTYPSKREALLRIVYSFCDSDVETHINVIKALQERFDDSAEFLHCLTRMAHLEQAFNEDLLDLYLYYCMIGMGMSSPTLRASAVSVLPMIVRENPSLILQMLDKIATLSSDSWWEVRAQIIITLSALLDKLTSTEAEGTDRVLSLMEKMLSEIRNPLLVRVSLSAVAGLIQFYPSLCQFFVRELLNSSDEMRSLLLSSDEEVSSDDMDATLQLLSRPLSYFPAMSISSRWHPLSVVTFMAQDAKDRGLENFEAEHFQILKGCLNEAVLPEESGAWGEVFDLMKYYLYVALCDEDLCGASAEVLELLFEYLQTQALQSLPTLVGTLKLVYPNGPATCQTIVNDFLVGLYKKGDPFSAAMYSMARKLPEDIVAAQALSPFVSCVR